MSYSYKTADGTWIFRYSAPRVHTDEVARIRRRAIEEAKILNGTPPLIGSTTDLIDRYFHWQNDMPRTNERRKADSTLKENLRERQWLDKFFGAMPPSSVLPHYIYGYLDRRGKKSPAKANKEIALLSAVFAYGRRIDELRENPCRGIKYNPIQPKTKLVTAAEREFAMTETRTQEDLEGGRNRIIIFQTLEDE